MGVESQKYKIVYKYIKKQWRYANFLWFITPWYVNLLNYLISKNGRDVVLMNMEMSDYSRLEDKDRHKKIKNEWKGKSDWMEDLTFIEL